MIRIPASHLWHSEGAHTPVACAAALKLYPS